MEQLHTQKNKDTGEIATHSGIKPLQAPDIYGIFPLLFTITYNGKTYLIYDSPHDSSCMYHSLSAVMHPLFQESTLSATTLKKALVTFYSQRGEMCNNMERLLAIRFEDRLKDVKQKDHWGEYTDAFSLAKIYSIKFILAILNSTDNSRVLSVQEVHGFRKDDRRMARIREAERMLIFFQRNSHYGVAVPH